MKKIFRKEQGEFGVGSLIIFIAIIIVSAATAVMLIQVTYQLQQQAENTGQNAIQYVSMGIKIISIGGYRYNSSWGVNSPYHDTLDWIDIKISLIPGSPPISVDSIIIEISDGNNVSDLVYDSSMSFDGSANPQGSAGKFGAAVIRDMDPQTWSEGTITTGDVIRLFFNATACGLNLEPQTYFTIKIIPKHGVPTFKELTTPSPYVSRYVEVM